MHIAIEGLDGVGKTTVAKKLADKLNFQFIEKPLQYVIGLEHYDLITNRVVDDRNDVFKAMFFGMGNYLSSCIAQGANIVTDRHFASTYFWNYTETTKPVFDYLVKQGGKATITFVLLASADKRRERMLCRSPQDKDIVEKVFADEEQLKITCFLEQYQMPYWVIDTTALSIDEVLEEILDYLKNNNLCLK